MSRRYLSSDEWYSVLHNLREMIHESVNCAAGVEFVAYDAELLNRAAIEVVIRGMGGRLIVKRMLLYK